MQQSGFTALRLDSRHDYNRRPSILRIHFTSRSLRKYNAVLTYDPKNFTREAKNHLACARCLLNSL